MQYKKGILIGAAVVTALLLAKVTYETYKEASKDQKRVIKIKYKDFIKASYGVESEIKRIVDIYKNQNVLVISDIPKSN